MQTRLLELSGFCGLFLPAQSLRNAIFDQKLLTAFQTFAPSEQDYFHRRVEDERRAAVRADDPVLVEYKFGGAFHRPDILLPLTRLRDELLCALWTFQVLPIDALVILRLDASPAVWAFGCE